MLGVPWLIERKTMVKYNTDALKARNISLPSSRDSTKFIKVQNLGVKKFRSFLSKKKENNENFVVYQMRHIKNTAMANKFIREGPNEDELLELREEFQSVFTDELHDDLRSEHDVNHKSEAESGSTPPPRRLFRLSPAKLIATKEYVKEVLRKVNFVLADPLVELPCSS